MFNFSDTICAPATTGNLGAISVVRISGPEAFAICGKVFRKSGRADLSVFDTHTVHYGTLYDGDNVLDVALATIFKAPHSYSGEDTVEFSVHGSSYIVNRLLQLLVENGARIAGPGEFTLRAFRNGKLDLIQAEAVADLIYSNSQSAHRIAMKQIRGGFSTEIKYLRHKLTEFASLLELELDFSEEDVEFANRTKLNELLEEILQKIQSLRASYQLGNVIKKGIPITITGKPNVGKSTLLNCLLNEEKAIVSEIPGTTRDAIEDTIVINGYSFRFIDTAGLRESNDVVENLGIDKTWEKLNEAMIILYVVDISETTIDEIKTSIARLKEKLSDENKKIILIANKIDLLVEAPKNFKDLVELETIFISAKRKENIRLISESLIKAVNVDVDEDQTLISNARHYESLSKTYEALQSAQQGLNNNISTDLIATDIRNALYHLGTLTGLITSDDILNTIFDRFCIGK